VGLLKLCQTSLIETLKIVCKLFFTALPSVVQLTTVRGVAGKVGGGGANYSIGGQRNQFKPIALMLAHYKCTTSTLTAKVELQILSRRVGKKPGDFETGTGSQLVTVAQEPNPHTRRISSVVFGCVMHNNVTACESNHNEFELGSNRNRNWNWNRNRCRSRDQTDSQQDRWHVGGTR